MIYWGDKMRHFNHLTYNDRLKIEAWLKVGLSKKEISMLLGVHISTVYREIKRGTYNRLDGDTYTYKNAYSPDISQKKYQDYLSCKGADLKISNDYDFADFIEHKICKDKYSPASALAVAKKLGYKTSVCISTLYSYIDKGVFYRLTNKDLPIKRNKKHSYKKVKPLRASKGTSIEKRPLEVLKRNTFGHWEMDCVVGKKETKKTLLVLTERYTRQEIIRVMKDKTANSVVKAIDRIERQLGSKRFRSIFKTITVDNGGEFMDTEGIESSVLCKSKRTHLYYCHPYSSCERGSNENQNKLIRRHYPKGTSFDNLNQLDIDKLQDWINNYPRKIFNWHSSNDIFDACINSL